MLLGSPLGSLGRGHSGALIRPSSPVPWNNYGGAYAARPMPMPGSPTIAPKVVYVNSGGDAACARPTAPGPQPIAPSWQAAENDREARRKVIATMQGQLNDQGKQMQAMADQLDQATRALQSAGGACARPTQPGPQPVAPSWQAAENDREARRKVIATQQGQLAEFGARTSKAIARLRANRINADDI